MMEVHAGLNPRVTQVSGTASELGRLIAAVARSIPLDNPTLPDEFFPAHLTVALVDAVFHSQLRHGEQPARSSQRYCRRFGIARTRADRWMMPPVDEQETLGDLVRRYDELGVNRMMDEVFRTRRGFPGADIARTEIVLGAARCLECLGVEVLQDMQSREPQEFVDALRFANERGDGPARMLLMHAGEDDFVFGDSSVRRFVAHAVGAAVSADRAVEFVRSAAYELIVSPRYLDREIWKFGASW